MHFGAILVPKCSNIESLTFALLGHFGALAPQGRPRGPRGSILVTFLVPVPPFGCHFGGIWDPFVTISSPFGDIWDPFVTISGPFCDDYDVLVTFGALL